MDENKKKVQTDDGFDVRQIDVHELLLQQEPFVFIDQMTYYDERLTTSVFRVSPNHLYVEEGKLQTCALAEVIAQTCAARIYQQIYTETYHTNGIYRSHQKPEGICHASRW